MADNGGWPNAEWRVFVSTVSTLTMQQVGTRDFHKKLFLLNLFSCLSKIFYVCKSMIKIIDKYFLSIIYIKTRVYFHFIKTF